MLTRRGRAAAGALALVVASCGKSGIPSAPAGAPPEAASAAAEPPPYRVGHAASGIGELAKAINPRTLTAVTLRSGSFWTGYLSYSLDPRTGRLEGVFDYRDLASPRGGLRRTRRVKTLPSLQVKGLLAPLRALAVTTIAERCGRGADGEESLLVLTYHDRLRGRRELRVTDVTSSMFVCADVYVSNQSFAALKSRFFQAMPKPQRVTDYEPVGVGAAFWGGAAR